jgi:hypothetical protein
MKTHALSAVIAGITICAGAPRADAYSNKSIRHAAEKAESQVARASGVKVPFRILKTKVKDAYSQKRHVVLYSGLGPTLIKGVEMHEDGHVLLGHTTFHANIPRRLAEAQADYAAGYFLARSGHARGKYVRAYLKFVKDPVAGYPTPAQRVAATRAGIAAGLRDSRTGLAGKLRNPQT